MKFFGYIIRENSLEKLALEGLKMVQDPEGRQRKKYLDDLVATMGCLRKGELFHLLRTERDSNAW